MPSIGEALREQRLQRGLTVEDAAARLRISARLLEALEAEEFDKLPGRFFARSFMRQYARFLGLDAAPLEAALAGLEDPAEPEAAPPEEAPRITVAPLEPHPGARRYAFRRWLGALGVLVLAVAACAALYALWLRFQAAPAPGVSLAPAADPAQPPAAPAEPAPAAATAPPSPAGSAPLAAAPAAPIVLELRATAAAWFRLTSDGRLAFEGTLLPGQSRAFQAQESLSLFTGNAGGLTAVFNGQPLGPLGPQGQLRVLELSPSSHRILERKPPPEPGDAPDAAPRGAAAA